MIKLGYINGAKNGLLSIEDVIKLDIAENPNVDVTQNDFGFSTVHRRPLRATINLEMDWLSENNYGLLRKYMNDRTYPQKIFIAHPADTSQYIDFASITSPSNTHQVFYLKSGYASATPATMLTYGTEFDNSSFPVAGVQWAAYSALASEDTNQALILNTAYPYTHLLFKFKLNDWVALFSSQAAAINAIRRITLFCSNLESFALLNNYGYVMRVWDNTNSLWVEFARRYYHVTGGVALGLKCQQTAAIRSQEGFPSYASLIDEEDYIQILISNVNSSQGGLQLYTYLNYIALLINGYGVAWTNADNFTYRDTFTGAGFTGTMELLEV